MISPYLSHILILTCIYIMLAQSLNLALGFTGLLSLAHIAFAAIGAYTSALLVLSGIPFPIAFLFAGLLAGIFGFIVMYATRKVKGDYLALATLAFTFVTTSILLNWTSLTNGALGIAAIPKPTILGITIAHNDSYLLFAIIITVITYLIIKRVTHSPFGKLLEATRDDELGLRVMGKNTSLLKLKAMTVSAFFAGIAGSLYAHHYTYIEPFAFSLVQLIFILTIVIVGGLASNKGVLVAGIVMMAIPELIRFLPLPNTMLGPLRLIIYAMLLVTILLFKPRGIFGRIDIA